MERVKLSYSAPLRRVKVAVMPLHCRKGEKLAKEMIRRAKAKCEAEVKAERINLYRVYEAEFLKLWQFLQGCKDIAEDTWVHFTLAQGGMRMQGIEVEADDSNKSVFKLHAKLDQLTQKHLNWPNFRLNIEETLKTKQISIQPHEGMLRSCYLKLKSGRELQGLRIKANPTENDHGGKKIAFSMNSERQEAYLYLADKDLIRDRKTVMELVQRIENIMTQVQRKFPQAVLLKEDLIRNLQMFNKGPEHLGLRLPRTILFAISDGNVTPSTKPVAAASEEAAEKRAENPKAQKTAKIPEAEVAKNRKDRGNWLFKFDIDELGMHAKIKAVNEFRLYESPGMQFGREQMIRELHKVGIKACYENFIEKILNIIALEGNLIGQTIAMGETAVPGEIPYVHPVYLDKDPNREDVLVEDIRSAQNKDIVKKGDLIAEVRYRDGQPGRNVYGEVTHILAHESILNLVIGEGVAKVKDGQFCTTIDGMPVVDDKKIECSPIYIHEGDVNLTSGNVIFDGSAEIHGNIEAGATVIVTGHLIVKGTIGRAFVRCGGDLRVKGGIVAGNSGWVEAGGNMFAEFIENAKVAVSNNLEVRKSIMNSYIIVGDTLRMKDLKEGTIGGGHISVRNVLHTANLGFEDGKKTFIRIGSDWLVERRITIQESRKERLEKAFEVEKKNVEELQNKKFRNAEVTKLLDVKSKKVHRLSIVIRKIERKVTALTKIVSWNREALVKVEELIVKNIDLTVGGKVININEDLKSVLITFHKYHDNRIHPLEIEEAYLKSRSTQMAS
ncbi:MAG: DUF342 domain-containing protein [Oligoflexus sp.]